MIRLSSLSTTIGTLSLSLSQRDGARSLPLEPALFPQHFFFAIVVVVLGLTTPNTQWISDHLHNLLLLLPPLVYTATQQTTLGGRKRGYVFRCVDLFVDPPLRKGSSAGGSGSRGLRIDTEPKPSRRAPQINVIVPPFLLFARLSLSRSCASCSCALSRVVTADLVYSNRCQKFFSRRFSVVVVDVAFRVPSWSCAREEMMTVGCGT